MLSIRGLRKTFWLPNGKQVIALDDLSLQIASGEFVVLIGTNGAGKTTLFEAIVGKISVDSGSICLGDTNITKMPAHHRSPFVTLINQQRGSGLPRAMTTYEVLRLGAETAGIDHSTKAIRKCLDTLEPGLSRVSDTQIWHISGGEYQLVSLALASILCEKNPDSEHLLLLDEHVSQLAPTTQDRVLDATRRLVHNRQLTTILSTHSPTIACAIGSRQIVISSGRVAADLLENNRICHADGIRNLLRDVEKSEHKTGG